MTDHDRLHSPILAIHPGALGDCILLGRVLEKLDGEVSFVGHGAVAELLLGLKTVSKKIDYDLLPMHELFTDAPPEQTRLAELLGTCDRLISVYGEGNPALQQRLIQITGAKKATFLPIRPPAEYPGHLTELWLEKLASPLRKQDLCTSAWSVPADWIQAGQRRLAEAGIGEHPCVVLHPGAGGEKKRWPIERFAELAALLQTRGNTKTVFVLGPVECEKMMKSEINFLHSWPVVFDPSLEEFTGLLSRAQAFIGNDSGPAHLAASIGMKTSCIFCVTSATRFSPLGKSVSILHANDMPEFILKSISCTIFGENVGQLGEFI